MKSLLQGIEMMSGLSEASQGKVPKQISAASAIDQLITASQVVVRLEGQGVEDFLSRLGRLMISRVIQYYTGERLLHMFGQDGEVIQAAFSRAKLLGELKKENDQRTRDEKLQDLFRDLNFKVKPFSSLESSHQRQLQIDLLLFQMGLVPGLDVLKSARKPNPEATMKQAQEEQAEKMKSAMIGKAAMGGKGGGGGKGGKLGNQPNPAAQRGIPGAPA
jgi:hypothetical protein